MKMRTDLFSYRMFFSILGKKVGMTIEEQDEFSQYFKVGISLKGAQVKLRGNDTYDVQLMSPYVTTSIEDAYCHIFFALAGSSVKFTSSYEDQLGIKHIDLREFSFPDEYSTLNELRMKAIISNITVIMQVFDEMDKALTK